MFSLNGRGGVGKAKNEIGLCEKFRAGYNCDECPLRQHRCTPLENTAPAPVSQARCCLVAERGITIVAEYRTFRNTDPPRLAEAWNAIFTGRGAVPLLNSSPLEQYVFAKPIFDPAGLFLAEEGGNVIGVAHAALSAAPSSSGPVGVVCLIGVRQEHRRGGIGTELLRRCEAYLRDKGAAAFQAGPAWPHNPFYLGLYGGCDSPGFLGSDPLAEPFFLHHQYEITKRFLILQKDLAQPIKVVDPRFGPLRSRLEMVGSMPRRLSGYWQECVLGFIEPIELRVVDRSTEQVLARTLVWEMEGFARRWGGPAIGILRFEVNADLRRQGIGKFLLAQLLRQVREQFFETAEIQLESTNADSIRFLQSLAFDEVDFGHVYTRTG